MELHQKVADFTVQTDEDKTIRLSEYAGQPVILFFYPRVSAGFSWPACRGERWHWADWFGCGGGVDIVSRFLEHPICERRKLR